MRTITIRKVVPCPHCHGTGRVFSIEECTATFGIAWFLGLVDKNLKAICPECEGDKVVWQTQTITIE